MLTSTLLSPGPTLLADGAAAPGGSAFTGMLPLILMFAVFYFLVIHPQSKADKQRRKRVAAIEKGDRVVLEGGIVGRVTNPDAGEGLCTVEIADRVKIRVIRSRIHDKADAVLKAEDKGKDKAKDKDKAAASGARAS